MDAFYQITDDGFPGAKSLDFIGQRIVYVEPFGRYWGWSDLVDASSWNSLEQAQAETSPDRIQGLIVSHNEVLIFGERTIEPWAHAPTETAVFQLQVGSVIESGCASGRTIQRLDNSVFYLTNNGQIAKLNGYTPQVISTAAMEASIRGLNWSRAFAFTWEDAGHVVYYITFPDGHTWGFDVRQNKWHRRASYGLDRWRINALAKSNGKYIAGDYSSGRVYEVEWGNVYEACEIMPRTLTTGVLHSATNRITVYGFSITAATGQPAVIPAEPVDVSLLGYRWLGTGATGAGTRASVQPMSTAMAWIGPVDSEVTSVNTTAIVALARFGETVFSLLDNNTCRIAELDSITAWADGPTGLTLGNGLGHVSVFGDRLWVACGTSGVATLSDPDDAAFVTSTAMLASFPSSGSVGAITGNGDNVLCLNFYGGFARSSDGGATWATGADMFGTGNRFYTSYGAMDSNADRVVAGGGETGLLAYYTDNNGVSFTDCTVPSAPTSIPNQIRYVGDNRWLIACNFATTATNGLFKSTDNGETFTAVTLPAALKFTIQSKQNIAVDPNTGRVVIAGVDVATDDALYYWSDDLITWTAITPVGSGVFGIAEIYHVANGPLPDSCTPMEGGRFQLRYASDGAENWSNWRDFESPTTGRFLQPLVARRLGMARHRVWEVMDTSNRPQDVLAAEIIAQ